MTNSTFFISDIRVCGLLTEITNSVKFYGLYSVVLISMNFIITEELD